MTISKIRPQNFAFKYFNKKNSYGHKSFFYKRQNACGKNLDKIVILIKKSINLKTLSIERYTSIHISNGKLQPEKLILNHMNNDKFIK